MNNELLVKIQEKIGATLDLITFENIHQLVKYIVRYIALNNYVPVAIVMMIFSIGGFIAIPKIYKYEKEKILNDAYYDCDIYILTILSTTATILFTLFALIEIYQIIMIIMFPEMAVINWLK